MNQVVKKILTVSAMSFSIIAINGGTVNAAQAVCVKPVQFRFLLSLLCGKPKGNIKPDAIKLSKLNKDIANKHGAQYLTHETISVPASNVSTGVTYGQALKALNQEGILNKRVTAVSNATATSDKMRISAEKEGNMTVGPFVASASVNNNILTNQLLFDGTTSVTPDRIPLFFEKQSGIDEAHVIEQLPMDTNTLLATSNGVPLNVNLSLNDNNLSNQPIVLNNDNDDGTPSNYTISNSDGYLQRNTAEDWNTFDKWNAFNQHTGSKWMFSAAVEAGVQFNSANGGHLSIEGVFEYPFNKTISCVEQNTDSKDNNSGNTGQKQSSYDLTLKCAYGIGLSAGVDFTEKIIGELNLKYKWLRASFAPTASDSKSSENSNNTNTNNNNALQISDKFDMKGHGIEVGAKIGYKFTEHVVAFVSVSYSPTVSLSVNSKSSSNQTIPCSVEYTGGFKGGVGVQFLF